MKLLGEPKREELKVESKRGILVAITPPGYTGTEEQAVAEIKGLAKTAGVDVVGHIVQRREHPHVATYLGSGKLDELKMLMKSQDAELAVFDNSLSPSQGRNIEKLLDIIVVDRSEVILDIFATHARTYEAKLQVELAQLLYLRPRLTRMWTHLERIEGGIGSGRGPGEKQLEMDRRLIDRRIAELRRKLKDVEKRRERLVSAREETPTVSLVGYTNAGKSTLMNALTGADVYVADKLFATLDTRTRRWKIPHWGEILLSDTVGFVRDLPHHLVASFKSTLEEARNADLLLHVVDASDPEAEQQIETVNSVLEDLGANEIDSMLVLNKVDRLEDRSAIDILRAHHEHSISTSAVTGVGLERLTQVVAERLGHGIIEANVEADVGNGRLYSFLAEHAEVTETTYNDGNRVTYRCRIPYRFTHQVRQLNSKLTPVDSPVITNGAPSSLD